MTFEVTFTWAGIAAGWLLGVVTMFAIGWHMAQKKAKRS